MVTIPPSLLERADQVIDDRRGLLEEILGSRTSTPGGPDDFPRLVQGIAGGESDTVLAHRTVAPVVNVRGMCTETDPPPRPTCHGGLGLRELPTVTPQQVIHIDSGRKR